VRGRGSKSEKRIRKEEKQNKEIKDERKGQGWWGIKGGRRGRSWRERQKFF
jgi:hypothetical protein